MDARKIEVDRSLSTKYPLPKRHHFVPEMLQKNFANSDGILYFFRKEQPALGVRVALSGDLFVQGHLYSSVDKENRKDPALELWLSKLETKVSPLIERVIAQARLGKAYLFSSTEKEDWVLFLYTQWRRVPDLLRIVNTQAEADNQLDEIFADLIKMFPHRKEEILGHFTPEARKRHIQNARVDALKRRSEQIEAVMKARGVDVLKINNPKKSFITGSFPVVKMANQNLLANDSEVWLPVAFDVALGLGKFGANDRLLNLTNPAGIRHLNISISAQSSMIAGRSEELIESLSTHR